MEWAETAKDSVRSRLFLELAGIRSGAFGSIRTACLTLAVSIESITSILLDGELVEKPESEEKAVSELLGYLGKWRGDEQLIKRVEGMLTSKGVRPVDRLHAFVNRIGISPEIVVAWKKLRNVQAHGGNIENEQELYDLYYSTTELLYRIICSAIGYHGQLTPTSHRGWGLDQWGFPAD